MQEPSSDSANNDAQITLLFAALVAGILTPLMLFGSIILSLELHIDFLTALGILLLGILGLYVLSWWLSSKPLVQNFLIAWSMRAGGWAEDDEVVT